MRKREDKGGGGGERGRGGGERGEEGEREREREQLTHRGSGLRRKYLDFYASRRLVRPPPPTPPLGF
jgi:hypothetical protein